MKDYELMVTLKPNTDEAAIEALIEKMKNSIEKGKGVVLHLEKMGRREFATEFKKLKEGYYFYVDFSADKAILDVLDKMLKINEDVVRFLLVTLDSIKVTPKG